MQETRAISHGEEWYLVANRDNLSVRIRHSVTVGEDEYGQLVFDDKISAARWITLQVSGAGELTVTHQDPRVRLTCHGQWVADNPGTVLPRGTLLELPHNEIYLSQHMRRGQPTQTVHVSMQEAFPPILLEEPGQPRRASSPDAVPQPAPSETDRAGESEGAERRGPTKAAKGAPTADVRPVARPPSPGQQAVSERHRLRAQELAARAEEAAARPAPVTVPDIVVAERAAESEPDIKRSGSGVWVWMAVIGILLGGAYTQREALFDATPKAQALSTTTPVSGTADVQGPVAVAALPTPAPVVRDTSMTNEPAPRTAPVAPVTNNEPSSVATVATAEPQPTVSAPSTPPPVPVASAADGRDVGADLNLARRLLTDGYIIWPEENAVSIARGVLEADPGSLAAQQILSDAAAQLVVEAERAYVDGFRGAAIDTVEAVLRFDAEHDRARLLLGRWVQAAAVPDRG